MGLSVDNPDKAPLRLPVRQRFPLAPSRILHSEPFAAEKISVNTQSGEVAGFRHFTKIFSTYPPHRCKVKG
jgi:hypothetical protein